MATIKQKKAVDNMVDNGGNVSKAMTEAGYSPATAKTPQKLTQSKGFEELLEEYLPDSMLLKALQEDIEGKTKNRKPELELAFKVKGKLTDRLDVGGDLTVTVVNYADADTKPLQT